ncbi:unnamed protein product [Bursaphelenchus okinawaensis]|uniref:Uncharacterized protein n=1 Tax=Bursaphelenchus okinawaensis TaxID=465554 RepID=A0A811L3C2_9BILA|nr:unnamed protein product [Bursaphelenchus okinawaensis]CAG9115260.1 unnamed protein product [Bursaphelenchus okinawaensis]
MDSLDRLPAANHYVRTGEQQSTKRPSIFDLMHGQPQIAPVQNGLNGGLRVDRTPSCRVSVVKFDEPDEKEKKQPKKFGWIEGVFLRCVLNIVGVILYIRLSWITGQAGILFAQLIVLLASTVTTITALSLCAICTNGEVKGGGAYFLISRSLGPEFGGPIGIIFSLANAVGAAMYIVGFAETLKDYMKEQGFTFLDGDINEIRVIGLVACTVLICIVMVGTGFESKLQMVLLAIMLVSFVDYFGGTFVPPSEDKQKKGVTGYCLKTLQDNMFLQYRDNHNFFSVFSIYFPAATGIMAGANISGDLKRPEKALPLGTLLAIAFTTVLYSIVIFVAGSTVIRDADGVTIPVVLSAVNGTISGLVEENVVGLATGSLSGQAAMGGIMNPAEAILFRSVASEAGNIGSSVEVNFLDILYETPVLSSYVKPNCSLHNSCEYGLLNYFQVMELSSLWGPLITAGIFASSLSSALLSLVSSAKVFQAVCQDGIFPYVKRFSQGSPRDGEPRRGYLLVYIIAMLIILIGDLDLIAPIISNFFLGSYVLVNYACFDNSFAQNPGFRPGFKYYNKWVSLAGSILCVTVMFIISWLTALITFLFFGLLFVYILKRRPGMNWGASPQAHCYRNALASLTRLDSIEHHVKNYRPQIMLMTGNPMERGWIVDFVSNITKDTSLLLCANVITRVSKEENPSVTLQNLNEHYQQYLKDQKIKAFFVSTINETMREGALQLIRTAGLGKMKPNVLFLGYKEHWLTEGKAYIKEVENYVQCIQDAFDAKMGVIILRRNQQLQLDSFYTNQPKDDSQEMSIATIESPTSSFKRKIKKSTIDVWWLYDDGGLSLLIPHLLTYPKSYLEQGKLRLFTISYSNQVTEAQRDMMILMKKFRLKFKDIIVLSDVGMKPQHSTLHDYNVELKDFRGEERGMITDIEWKCHEKKTNKHLRISEVLQEHSKNADLVVLSMPVPRKHMSSVLYLSWLHQLTKNLPPTLLIRGNQESVLTFYT